MPELADWDSFYVIVGSAAGALIGLQFVVMTLVAQRPPAGAGVADAAAAFGTPTVVYFSTVLFLAALLRAPWRSTTPVAVLCALVGVGGAAYAANVVRRMRAQTAYEPVLEDWLFHALLPLTAYPILALSAVAAASDARDALFGVGAATVLLLFVGIHNAWDSVAYHVLVQRPKMNE